MVVGVGEPSALIALSSARTSFAPRHDLRSGDSKKDARQKKIFFNHTSLSYLFLAYKPFFCCQVLKNSNLARHVICIRKWLLLYKNIKVP
jgi:hypothetical protein